MIKAVEQLSTIPANENPFWHDSYHMGADIAKDLTAMFADFEGNRYLILINKSTGERIKLWFEIDKPWQRMGDFNKDDAYYNWECEANVPIVQRKEPMIGDI